ncbi:hypothetical protein FN846DRAFT_889982 [Sphaerosporella brunnea]|uniref:Uncharacterized protein n=1 Tax=Sphaerosporella brunnea TaxID=1250544 RepID=A0A5J5EY12_9PEZI|nr:hypothetical protein FN846DRAFT_889982 [Sphaerosporella brunnea]
MWRVFKGRALMPLTLRTLLMRLTRLTILARLPRPTAAAETTQAAGIYLPLPLYRALPDSKLIVPLPPTITASDQPDDTKKRKRKGKRRRKVNPDPDNHEHSLRHHQQTPMHKEKKPENDKPCNIPKVTGAMSACDRVRLPGPEMTTDNQQPGLAVTPEPASVSAVHEKPWCIYGDVSNYTAWPSPRMLHPIPMALVLQLPSHFVAPPRWRGNCGRLRETAVMRASGVW